MQIETTLTVEPNKKARTGGCQNWLTFGALLLLDLFGAALKDRGEDVRGSESVLSFFDPVASGLAAPGPDLGAEDVGLFGGIGNPV